MKKSRKMVCIDRSQVITRTKTAREILDEYERLAKEREERRFNQVTNPNVCVTSRTFFLQTLI